MMETTTADGIEVRRLLDRLETATGYEQPLRRRTEGMTWILWGLVLAGMYLCYLAADALVYHVAGVVFAPGGGVAEATVILGPSWAEELRFLWALWLVAGILATWALWRLVGVTLPDASSKPGRLALSVGIAVVAVVGVWVAAGLLMGGEQPATIGILVLPALAWVLLGMVNVARLTPTGRRTMIGIGATVALVSLVLAPWINGNPDPEGAALAVGALLGGGVPIVGGLLQVLRG